MHVLDPWIDPSEPESERQAHDEHSSLNEIRSRSGTRLRAHHPSVLVPIIWLLFLFYSKPSACHGRLVVHPAVTPTPTPTSMHRNDTTFTQAGPAPTTATATAYAAIHANTTTAPSHNTTTSTSTSWLSFAAPTWVYVSPSIAGYNITAPIVRVDIQVIGQLEPYRDNIQGNIVWVPNYHVVRIYLETLIRACISYGCRGLVFSSRDYPDTPGVFRFADGSASRSGGSGLTIPLINLCQDDAAVLYALMSTPSGDTIVTITDGDDNEPLREFGLTMWKQIGYIQYLCAGIMWILCTFRLFQWYRHWRYTGHMSYVAVVSLLLEHVATGIRAVAPQPEENITGQYHFYLVHGCNLTQIGITGIVDILIVCYFADTIHESSGASALGSRSSTFVTRNRSRFFLICVLFCVTLGISIGLGVGLYMTPDQLFLVLRVSYAVVMIGCIILLYIMVTKVRAALASVLDIIQPAQLKPFQARITRITSRVVASMIGMVSTIAAALAYLIASPDSVYKESIWAALLFAGAQLSSLAHIETFHCPTRQSVAPTAPAATRDRSNVPLATVRPPNPGTHIKPIIITHMHHTHHTNPHEHKQASGNATPTKYHLLDVPTTGQESTATEGQENGQTISGQEDNAEPSQQHHIQQQKQHTHPTVTRIRLHSVDDEQDIMWNPMTPDSKDALALIAMNPVSSTLIRDEMDSVRRPISPTSQSYAGAVTPGMPARRFEFAVSAAEFPERALAQDEAELNRHSLQPVHSPCASFR